MQVPPHREYTTDAIPVAALAIVLKGRGYADDGNGRQELTGGVALFVPARTAVLYTSAGEDDLWVCLARSNLNINIGGSVGLGGSEGSGGVG